MERDRRLDKRLVRTFLQTLIALVTLRDRVNGLVLSELGGYLESPEHAPAGTKRLSRLWHAGKWEAGLSGQFLWQRARRACGAVAPAGCAGIGLLGRAAWS